MKVLAKDAKAGQWYVDSDGTRFLCCDGRRLWTPEGETWSAYVDKKLTHLPDCTGWDWQPPKPEKKYRAFASREEWWPNRDRWVLGSQGTCCLMSWVNPGVASDFLEHGYVFLNDDGTDAEPFGVEVTE